jgi:hypothetical protein
VTLNGNVSDYDGDTLSYQWMEGTNVFCLDTVPTLAGGDPVVLPQDCILGSLGLGTHTITLRVDDGTNAPVLSQIAVEIIDIQAPTLSPMADKTILWPPNHGMVPITIQTNATDNSGLPVMLNVSVSSNEAIDGLGDGDTSPDWTEPVFDQETGAITFQLRAERSGSGNGRQHTITITATDASGNSSTANVKILVPHDKPKK